MPRSTVHKPSAQDAFAQRLRDCLVSTGRSATSPTHLAREFNVRYSGPSVHVLTCRKWLLGEAIPTQDKLVALAHMLGVTPEWLRYGQGGLEVREPVSTPYNRKELALLGLYQELGPHHQEVLVGVAQLLRHAKEKKTPER